MPNVARIFDRGFVALASPRRKVSISSTRCRIPRTWREPCSEIRQGRDSPSSDVSGAGRDALQLPLPSRRLLNRERFSKLRGAVGGHGGEGVRCSAPLRFCSFFARPMVTSCVRRGCTLNFGGAPSLSSPNAPPMQFETGAAHIGDTHRARAVSLTTCLVGKTRAREDSANR